MKTTATMTMTMTTTAILPMDDGDDGSVRAGGSGESRRSRGETQSEPGALMMARLVHLQTTLPMARWLVWSWAPLRARWGLLRISACHVLDIDTGRDPY